MTMSEAPWALVFRDEDNAELGSTYSHRVPEQEHRVTIEGRSGVVLSTSTNYDTHAVHIYVAVTD